MSASNDFQARLWINQGTEFKFAEREQGFGNRTGVCFSGGGTRSLSATMGQLRGLNHLGLIGKIDYISCVSGGSWASTAYTYFLTSPPGSKGPITDEDFLGPVTPPGKIQVLQPSDPDANWLGFDGPKRLGTTATQSLAGALFSVIVEWTVEYLVANSLLPSLDNLEKALESLPYDQVWSAAVGMTYFQPFGLFKLYNPFQSDSLQGQPFFSFDFSTVEGIRSRNPANSFLNSASFETVRQASSQGPRRPYLIINSSVIGPSALAPFKQERPIGFEYTSLYAGSPYSPFGKKVDYGSGTELLVGSGWVEPFAFGGQGPAQAPASCNPSAPPAQCATVPRPPIPFTLAEASGTSSSAFASVIEQNPVKFVQGLDLNAFEKFVLGLLIDLLQKETDLLQLSPRELYWPVTSQAGEPTTKFTFGDGGILENYGLIALLRRQVKTIVVFNNTATKLNLNFDPAHPQADDIDLYMPPLFGIQVASPGVFTQNNQVFPKDEFKTVVNKLKDCKRQGKPLIAEVEHTVACNGWWGVDGVKLNSDGNRLNPSQPVPPQFKVTVLWVYLERVPQWESKLTDTKFPTKDMGEITLLEAIQAGNPPSGKTPQGPFQYFPNYLTAQEDSDFDLVELTPQQVNLSADLTSWMITNGESSKIFKKLLGGE